MIAVLIILFISVVLNAGLIFVSVRFSKRLLQFDNMFSFIVDDVDSNISYFENLLSRPMLSNAPEVVELDRNLRSMRDRLLMISMAVHDVSVKDTVVEEIVEEQQSQKSLIPPVVVD